MIDGAVNALGQPQVGNAFLVAIEADHVAELSRRPHRAIVHPGEAATQVKHVRGRSLHLIAADAEVLLGRLRGEGGQVVVGLFRVGRGATCLQGLPRGVMRAPGRVEPLDRAVLCPQIGDERPLGRLIGGRSQSGFGQRQLVAPAQFVVDEVAQAPWVVGRGRLMPGSVGPNALGESGIEDVGEFAPVSLAALQRPAAAVDRDDVRRFPHLDRSRRPTSCRSCSCPNFAAGDAATHENCRPQSSPYFRCRLAAVKS